jgi:hypothetical protein
VKVTRRTFMAMLGAAAALLGLKQRPAEKPPTLWIGHF